MIVKFRIPPYVEAYIEIRHIDCVRSLPPTYSIPVQTDVKVDMIQDGEFPGTKPESKIMVFELDTKYEPHYTFKEFK